jgi:LAO/AO transport system kinase
LGDEIQAIKAGILEIADILIVNKADRPGADKTVQALRMMLDLEQGGRRQIRHHGQLLHVELPLAGNNDQPNTQETEAWRVFVLKTIASTGEGIPELIIQLDNHRQWLHDSGQWAVRERLRAAHTLENIIRAELTRRILARMPNSTIDALIDAICRRETDPYSAATRLIAEW